MCNFFSFVTDPINHPAEYYYLDWEYRKAHLQKDDADSHSHICEEFKLNEDRCNKYEFNPLTKEFEIDHIYSRKDDSEAAEKWANRLDFKTVVEPLIVKPIVNPFELPKVSEPTEEQIGWLKEWDAVRDSFWASVVVFAGASVRASVGNSVWASAGNSVLDSVWNSVRYSVWAQVRDSVGYSVGYSVRDSVWDTVGAYISTFIDGEYRDDLSPAVKLWEAGLVPSFDGTTWRLHSGKSADVVYEWTPEVQE